EEPAHPREPRFIGFRAHPADHARRYAVPVVGWTRRRRLLQRERHEIVFPELIEARPARVQMALDRNTLLDRQLVVMKRGEPLPHRRTGQSGHTSLNSARSPSRARASRDFTVPTAIPREKPISS